MKEKARLAKLPLRAAHEDTVNRAKRYQAIKWMVEAEVIDDKDEKKLLIYLYPGHELRKDNTQAAFRVFQTQDDYITQDLSDKGGFLTGALYHILSKDDWRPLPHTKIALAKSKSAITKFTGIKDTETELEAVIKLQNRIKDERLSKKHRRITDLIDAEMLKVPDVPESFKQWVNIVAQKSSRYIFYEYSSKKTLKGRCSWCDSDIELLAKTTKHGKRGTCPTCKSEVQYLSYGKASSRINDRTNIAIIQPHPDGLVAQYYTATREFEKGNTTKYRVKDYMHEHTRQVISFAQGDSTYKLSSYFYGWFKQTSVRWCKSDYFITPDESAFYPHNLSESLKSTPLKKAALNELVKSGVQIKLWHHLKLVKEHPQVEYMVKYGLTQLVAELSDAYYSDRWFESHYDPKGASVEDKLKTYTEPLRILKEINGGMKEFELLHKCWIDGIKIKANQVKQLLSYARVEDALFETLKHTTVHKLLRYFSEQRISHKDLSKRITCGQYRYHGTSENNDIYQLHLDYVRATSALGRDLDDHNTMYPSNLLVAHDAVTAEREAQKDKLEQIRRRKINLKIKRMSKDTSDQYNMTYRNWMIIAPKDAEDIRDEGKALHHCVGSYTDRIAEGKTVILFVREKSDPSKPFATMEVSNGTIIQCRGMQNNSYMKELEGLMNAFSQQKLQKSVVSEAM